MNFIYTSLGDPPDPSDGVTDYSCHGERNLAP